MNRSVTAASFCLVYWPKLHAVFLIRIDGKNTNWRVDRVSDIVIAEKNHFMFDFKINQNIDETAVENDIGKGGGKQKSGEHF